VVCRQARRNSENRALEGNNRINRSRLSLLLWVLGLASLAWGGPAAEAATPQTASYAGSASCRCCHEKFHAAAGVALTAAGNGTGPSSFSKSRTSAQTTKRQEAQ